MGKTAMDKKSYLRQVPRIDLDETLFPPEKAAPQPEYTTSGSFGRCRRWQTKRKLIIFAYLKSPRDRLRTHSIKHYLSVRATLPASVIIRPFNAWTRFTAALLLSNFSISLIYRDGANVSLTKLIILFAQWCLFWNAAKALESRYLFVFLESTSSIFATIKKWWISEPDKPLFVSPKTFANASRLDCVKGGACPKSNGLK